MAIRKSTLTYSIVITLFVTLETSYGVKRIHSFAGPYRVLGRISPNFTGDYNCLNNITVKAMFTPPSIKSTQFIWGHSYNSIPFDDTLDINVIISSWSNNQWKRNAFVMKFPGACSAVMKHAKSIMPYLFGEDGKKCPVAPGHRETKNQTFYPVFPRFPTFPYGRWLFDFIIHRKKTIYGVISVDGEAVPKL